MRSRRVERVLIVQLWGLGDTIMTLPIAAPIRSANAGAEVSWLISSPVVEDVLRLAGETGIHRIARVAGSRTISIAGTLVALRARRRFDVAVIATRHSVGLARLVRRLTGVPRVLCDAPAWNGPPQRPVQRADPEHRVVSNFGLVRELTGDADPVPPRIVLGHLTPAAAREGARSIGVHVGSEPKVPGKRYPLPLWRDALVQVLGEDRDASIVAYFGPGELEDATQLERVHPRLKVIRDATIAEIANSIARHHVFASGDSALGHLAAALGVPTVTVAGPTQIRSTHPFSDRNVVVLTSVNPPLPCQPCYEQPLFELCRHRSCLTTISPASVATAILSQRTPS